MNESSRATTIRLVATYALTGAVVGAALWILAPFLEGRREPWDGPHYLYRGGFLLSGLLLGALRPAPYKFALPAAWFGAWLGQLPFILGSEFQELGIIVTAIGSCFFVGGVFIGMVLLGRRDAPV